MRNQAVEKETASRRNTNRAQVQRCWPELSERLGQGETISYLYDDLSERGDIIMPLRTFMRWIVRFKDGTALPLSPAQLMKERGARNIYGRAGSIDPTENSNRRPRKKGEPYIGSIGIKPEPVLPNPLPDLKQLIGDDYDDL